MTMNSTTERAEHAEPAAPESRRRSVAKRVGAVLGPLFLFVGLPVALRVLLERVPWSGFGEIGNLGLALGISAMVGLLAAGRLRGWYLPGVKELLVALAIVVLSFVALPGFITREQIEHGQHVRMENNGRMVVEQILAADAERTAKGEPSVWPSVGKYDSANAYLSKLMAKGALSGVSTSMFAGGGVEAAADARDLERHGSAWSVLAGAGGAHPATPVLWTRNLRGLRPEDFADADPKRPRPWCDRLAPEEIPFGDRLVVLVRRDGRAETIRARDLTDASFLGGATNDPAALEVLEALADPAEDPEPHAESAESESHAEAAESESHAKSAEPGPHAESAEPAESLAGRAPSRPEGGAGAQPPSVRPALPPPTSLPPTLRP